MEHSLDNKHNSLFSDLNDDLVHQIFEYSHGSRFCQSATDTNSGIKINDIFRILPYVSKAFYRWSISYIQTTPINLRLQSNFSIPPQDLERLEWVRRHKMKLASFHIACSSLPVSQIEVIVNVLGACDTSSLSELNISCRIQPQVERPELDDEFLNEILRSRAGREIPVEIIQRLVEANNGRIQRRPRRSERQEILTDPKKFHRMLTVALSSSHNFAALKKLTLKMDVDQWHEPFFDFFSSTLEEMELSLSSTGASQDSSLNYISEGIERMGNLSKLKLSTNFAGQIKIKSKSLENIDTFWAASGFFVSECICPSLRLFRCEHNLFGNYFNGVKPVVPFGERDLEEHRFLKFDAGSRPFIGMQVPAACVVRL